MYASSEVLLESAKIELFENEDEEDAEFQSPIDRYRKHVRKFLERGDEWLNVRRLNVITRGSNTNNFSEATMRVLKDIILGRTKAFNVVALVDFCSSVLQKYLVKRLLQFAHGRRADPRLQYTELCEKMRGVDTATVTAVDSYRYLVPSQSNKSLLYSVDAEFGLCACFSGQTGAFCKHQALIHERFDIPFPNAPPVAPEDRYKLAVLALGSKSLNKDFYCDWRDVSSTRVQDPAVPEASTVEHSPANGSTHDVSPTDVTIIADSADVVALMATMQAEVARIGALVTPHSATALRSLLPCLMSLQSEEDLIRAAYQCRTALRARKGGSIKVQPTSIARRRFGNTRGCKRVAAGRPSSGIKRPTKRPRLLAANIDDNVPHAKSHGAGH